MNVLDISAKIIGFVCLSALLGGDIGFAAFFALGLLALYAGSPPRPSPRTTTNGSCVYILRDMDVTGYYKIGKSTRPKKRLAHFDTMLPFETELVHVIPARNCHALEAQLHRMFADKRIRGEWFALNDQDLKSILRMKGDRR